jgi:hypothetical protein
VVLRWCQSQPVRRGKLLKDLDYIPFCALENRSAISAVAAQRRRTISLTVGSWQHAHHERAGKQSTATHCCPANRYGDVGGGALVASAGGWKPLAPSHSMGSGRLGVSRRGAWHVGVSPGQNDHQSCEYWSGILYCYERRISIHAKSDVCRPRSDARELGGAYRGAIRAGGTGGFHALHHTLPNHSGRARVDIKIWRGISEVPRAGSAVAVICILYRVPAAVRGSGPAGRTSNRGDVRGFSAACRLERLHVAVAGATTRLRGARMQRSAHDEFPHKKHSTPIK